MEEVLIFAAKALVIFLSVGGIAILIAVLATRSSHRPELEVEPLHKHLKDIAHFLKAHTLNKGELKAEKKKQKAEHKKQAKNPSPQEGRVFVIDFKGDVQAHQVDNLREEVTAILQLATEKDEVIVKVESPGGVVHGYGLAASQLQRFRDHKIPLTICVDKVAASGGYMMACVANQIYAAPFAIIGSIGVVANVPNFNRLLKKHEVDYKEYTAGDYKRTVSLFGEITPKGEQKFQEQLADTHELFKEFVGSHRPKAVIGNVATGEYWFGKRALDLGLVDKITTSDDYLLELHKAEKPIYTIKFEKKKPLAEKLSGFLGQSLAQAADRLLNILQTRSLP